MLAWGSVDDIVHDRGKQFSHTADPCGICAGGSGTLLERLPILLGPLDPSPGHRVYDIEYT